MTPTSYPTRPEELPRSKWRRQAWTRRLLLALFAIPVIGSLFGIVGLRHADVASSAQGYNLRVRYPEISRPGIASALDIYVTDPDGFDAPVTLSISHEYFTLFDLNGIYPAPSSETVADDRVVWEFEPPEGPRFRVHVDWRVQPSVHRGTAAEVELEVGGTYITEVAFDTRLAP